MLLLKTRLENIPGVLRSSKHATHQLPKAEPGDLVLIAITRNTLPKGQKAIQYVARFRGLRQDRSGESIEIWKNPWRYVIDLGDVREADPFNIEDIQVSTQNYGAVRTHCALKPEDEEAVTRWLAMQPALKMVAERPADPKE